MSNPVLAVLQQRDGKLHKMSWEVIRAGQELASATGGRAAAVLIGAALEAAAREVAECDLEAVWVADDAKLADYTPAAYVEVLRRAAGSLSPRYLLFPHTYQAVDHAPRLAQALGAGLIPEVTAFALDEGAVVWRRPILNGKLEARVRGTGDGPQVISVQSGAFSADGVTKGSAPIQRLEIDFGEIAPDREILGVEEAAAGQVDLSQSEYIVAVGRGIGDADKLGVAEELAAALGAELGASRPVIDSGWLPRDRQIGSSGQTVSPKLYLAAGISGAIQHLVGMKGAQVIVAINKDPGAPIFNVAQYGIVGDLHEILPALTAAIREAKGS